MGFLPIFLLIAFFSVCPTEGRVPIFKDVDTSAAGPRASALSNSDVLLWPIPEEYRFGNETLTVDPSLSMEAQGDGRNSSLIADAFQRYKLLVFKHHSKFSDPRSARRFRYDITKLTIVVNSGDETVSILFYEEERNSFFSVSNIWKLQLGTDESYTLYTSREYSPSIVQGATIEANTIYGALRGLETFSQLCTFNYNKKIVEIPKAPWYIQDKPRFSFRGLLLDTSRHYLPISIIKRVIESMSYTKLNVLHWHIIDEESFPLEVPSYPNLWDGAYTKWERYTSEDASEVVEFAKSRGVNVMAEIDVPGHAESWGTGYPELWPSESCREPLDVSSNFTFDLISGILADMRKTFPFELFHLGGDEVNTDCWRSTTHIKQWLEDHNMTEKAAYQYFVLKAQEIAISNGWSPVNWEETFNAFDANLNPRTVVHNWLGPGVCPLAVAKGFKCIVSNQGVWYLDHLDIPWEKFYYNEPVEGIDDVHQQKLVLGGEVCMWGETVDASDIQQTIWPRAAAAAERLWSTREATSAGNATVLPRLEYFRCLLNQRGIAASPVTNKYARTPPIGPGSCYMQ